MRVRKPGAPARDILDQASDDVRSRADDDNGNQHVLGPPAHGHKSARAEKLGSRLTAAREPIAMTKQGETSGELAVR
jgi:hypothetical protein